MTTTGAHLLAELREILGDALLARFLAVFAGTSVTVSKSPAGAVFAELERVIGTAAAERVRQRFAGAQIYVPLNVSEERQKRNVEIAARIASGESLKSIARSYRNPNITVRHLRRIARAMKCGSSIASQDSIAEILRPMR